MVARFEWNGRSAPQGWLRWLVSLPLLLLIAGLFPLRANAGIALVQHASKDAGVTSSSSLAFPTNNTAGNWIGVAIRGGHSGQVFTVSDLRGNTYHQAVQFNQTLDAPNGETLAIYYAENIAGGTNTVTVAESISNNTLRFAILEYSGVATANSLDGTSAAQGSGTTLNSGNATTTANGDLVLGAVTTADGVTYTAASGYTIEERVPAAPSTKLVAEDEIQAVAGVVSVSATLSASNNGGALLAAFKAASGVLAPGITSLSPSSGPVGTSVTVTGTNFGASQGASTVTFNGVSAGTASSWNAASITVNVPSGASSGSVVVTVGGVASNGMAFTVTPPPPSITSLTPNSGPVGTSVTITGTNFGTSQGTSTVTFNGTAATPTSWSAASISVVVPTGATTGGVVVTVGGVASNAALFIVAIPPSITSLTPNIGAVGTSVTITGTNFGATQGTSQVLFGAAAATPTSWSTTSIVAPVPIGAATGDVVVVVGGLPSNGAPFTVVPSISTLNPTSGPAGTSVTISGSGFGSLQGTSTVAFNGTIATATGWSDTRITVPVPSGATSGNVVVTVGGNASNGVAFTVIIPPSITSLSPASGTVGTAVTITGTNFGASQGTSTVAFNGVFASLITSWNPTSIVATVPAPTIAGGGASTGPVVVTVGGAVSNGVVFTVLPSISSLNPTSGPAGTSVSISGSGFGSLQGTSTVAFNGTIATATGWSDTSITVPVPSGATTGNVVITVGGVASNGSAFTVLPSISSVSPNSGPVGTSVTISGNGFGTTQGTSTVTFNGALATPTSWSATSIVVLVPNNGTAGTVAVVVTVGGFASNGVNFSVTPAIASLSPTSGPPGTTVIITGTSFGTVQSSSTVTFNGIAGTPTSWSSTSIVVPVPNGATTGNVVVTLGTLASNGVNFTVTNPGPSITSVSPTSGPVGTSVTITGMNFGATQGTNTVTFNGTTATPTSWSTTSIVTTVPTGATTGNVLVTVGGATSNAIAFNVLPTPVITSLTPSSGQIGTSVTIAGANFGASQGTGTLTFNGVAATALNWSATSITAIVPTTTTGNVVVTVTGVSSTGTNFTVLPPSITSLNPASGPVGTSVTITSQGIGNTQGGSIVTFNGTPATPTTWTAPYIVAPVPAGATTGNVVVTVAGQASNGVPFTVTPNITSLTPSNGSAGTSITIAGTSFGATQGTSTVTFNGTAATPTSWSDTSITVPVPSGASTGNVVVTVAGQASNGVNFTVNTTPAPIKLVQHTSKDAGVVSSSALAFLSNNTAGNWIGVLIRAGHSGQVLTVSDARGNAYRQAVQFNQTLDTPNGETFAIYYAENIAAGANTVTVSESIANNTLRFAILEYSGVATASSLDVTAAAQGSGTTLSSGNATTTAGGDLLMGIVVTADGVTYTAGSGYTIEERVPAAPNTKLIAEDAIQTVAGVASASATLSASTNGGAALAAFKAASGGLAGPHITSVNPTSGPIGTSVTITGTNFGASQGTSTVTFNGVAAGTAGSWSATSITVNVPTGATTGNVVVTVGGIASNGVAFTVTSTAPSITSLNPTNGPVGTSVTITGTNFGAAQGTSTVTFNGTSASPTSWSGTSITAPVPAGASTGNVIVTVGGVASNGVAFTVTSTAPSITSLTPNNGPVGTLVTITGTNFGASQGTSTVTFHGIATTPTSWSATTIVAPVPTGATTGNVVVNVGGFASNGASFTVTVPTSTGITLVQHTSLDAGIAASASLTFPSNNTAGNFIAVVIRGGKAPQVFTVSDSRGNSYKQAIQASLTVDLETIAIYYAESIAGGSNTVTISESITNNTLRFAILEYSGVAPSGSLDVTAFAQGSDTEPSTGNTTTTAVGDLLIAEMTNSAGTTFGAGSGFTLEEVVPAAPGSRLVVEDSIQALPGVVSGTASMAVLENWGALLAAFRPATGSAGPHIVSLSPGTAPAGALVTIAGTNFGSAQGSSTVTFNGTAATPRSWSSTSIVVPVPAGATSGSVMVTVGGTPSNGVNFSVGFAPPIAFVQVNASQYIEVPLPSALKFISVPFKGAQTTGNLNVVVVGWLDSTTTISSVTDTAGNVYTLAVGPTILSGTATQAIYYAKDILPSPPNTNIVTVTFSKYATNADMRIAEYAGLDPSNPFDNGVAGQGSGTTSNSGSVLTTNANDLLVGANVVTASSTGAGAGFTSRVISPSGGILEDRIVASTGSYSATATLNPGSWIMQMAAFKAPTSAPPAISVAVTPGSSSTPTGYGAQNFAATLQNDVQRLGVTWTLSGSGCIGITCGLLSNATSSSVTYTAPANLPSPATVTLTATSVGDPTKTAGATITVTQGTLNVAISPKRAAVTMTQVQQFNAFVTNDPSNAGVVWSVDGNNGGDSASGTVSSNGLFTPGTQAGVHTVTATSVSNASVNVSATIAVTDFAGAFSYHYDAQSTGQNTKEYALTPATVNPSTFGLLFSCPVDGFMFASPLYVPSLTFGAQQRNVVFIATEHDSVYAFDADSPTCTQLWHTNFLGSGVMTVAPSDTGDGVSLVEEFGITSTPAVDPATNTIYVVANTKEIVGAGCSATSPCNFYRLHALDLITGGEKFGGPALISAPNFNPLFHLQRPALLLNNGTVYVAFGSHADLNIWQGWVMAYNATTLAQTYAWPSTIPTSGNNEGAIWGAGNPPVADASGNVYVITGNGTWDGTQNYADSVVKLGSTGSVLDYFTPFDQSTLSVNDIDFGSSGALILPDSAGSVAHPHLMLATGKIGVIYLLDQANLGKFHSGSNQDVQEVTVGFNLTSADSGFYGQPAYWNGNIYAVMVGDSLRQFPISNGVITNPALSVANKLYPYRGATPSVSSSGITNGIVWVNDVTEYQSNGPTVLDAYDASHVATMLYSSPVSGAGAACSTSKFTVPVVANGKVYVSGSNCFSVFGLLPN